MGIRQSANVCCLSVHIYCLRQETQLHNYAVQLDITIISLANVLECKEWAAFAATVDTCAFPQSFQQVFLQQST